MSLTISPVVRDDFRGRYRWTVTTFTGDTSYPTGGYDVTPANLGMVDYLVHTMTNMIATGASVTFCRVQRSTGKLLMYTAAGEVANATNVASVQCIVEAVGV